MPAPQVTAPLVVLSRGRWSAWRCALRVAGAIALVAFVAGCATHGFAPISRTADHAAVSDCLAWYRELDARIDAAGVRDAQSARVPGFPYLRSNRLLASFRAQAARDPRVARALAEQMRALDLQAREFELANLSGTPSAAADEAQAATQLERARRCSMIVLEADWAVGQARAAMIERAVVPDAYSGVRRALGLYALTRLPFSAGVRRYERSVQDAFARDLELPPGVTLLRHAPPAAQALGRAEVAALLAQAASHPLGLAELSAPQWEALFATYAPVFEIEVAGEHDRFGLLAWASDRPVPQVQSSRPVAYVMPAWTRYAGRTLLQLVYTIWFAERPRAAATDLLWGQLDGIVWRVTLAPDGEPVLYDSMHPCGCFHLFFPTPRARARPAPDEFVEWMFAPQDLPRALEGERVVLRIAARTHALERIGWTREPQATERYTLRPYDELRSLPRPDGRQASVFGPDGLVAGTERTERFVFWPMGIASAGAMRQWGHHATAFVGRRHFDDADLLERRFAIDLR